MIFGNCSLWENVQFVGLELPPALLARFPGPRHGIAGIRALLGAPRACRSPRAAMKPQGMRVPEIAAMCRTLALAGIDIIKDDHGIADQTYSPFAERVAACQAAIAEAVRATGKPSFYAPHLIGTPRTCCASTRGSRATRACASCSSRRWSSACPRSASWSTSSRSSSTWRIPSFGGAARIAPPLLFGRLFRLLGADAPIFVNYGGRFAYPQADCGALADGGPRAVGRAAARAAGPGRRDAARPRRRAARVLRPRHDAAHRRQPAARRRRAQLLARAA